MTAAYKPIEIHTAAVRRGGSAHLEDGEQAAVVHTDAPRQHFLQVENLRTYDGIYYGCFSSRQTHKTDRHERRTLGLCIDCFGSGSGSEHGVTWKPRYSSRPVHEEQQESTNRMRDDFEPSRLIQLSVTTGQLHVSPRFDRTTPTATASCSTHGCLTPHAKPADQPHALAPYLIEGNGSASPTIDPYHANTTASTPAGAARPGLAAASRRSRRKGGSRSSP